MAYGGFGKIGRSRSAEKMLGGVAVSQARLECLPDVHIPAVVGNQERSVRMGQALPTVILGPE